MAVKLTETLLCTILSVLAMFAITKIIGYRQMSEMTLFDYVNGITVGSIGAELATASTDEFIYPLLAMIIFGGVAVLLAVVTSKSRRVRGYVNGTPLVLFKNGKMYRKNFSRARVDIDEFLMQCRNQGYFDLAQVECIIMEVNGSLSILPKAAYRPATPQDMNMCVAEASLPEPVILDGKADADALRRQGLDKTWLDKSLAAQGFSSPQNVFFAYAEDGTLHAFPDVRE